MNAEPLPRDWRRGEKPKLLFLAKRKPVPRMVVLNLVRKGVESEATDEEMALRGFRAEAYLTLCNLTKKKRR